MVPKSLCMLRTPLNFCHVALALHPSGDTGCLFYLPNFLKPNPASFPSCPSPQLTFRDNALHTDYTAEEAGGQSPRRDVLGAKAALQPYVELFILLGISSINGGHKIL